MLLVVPAVVLAFVLGFSGVSPTAVTVCVVAYAALIGFGIAAAAVRSMGRGPVAIVVQAGRIAITHAGVSTQTLERSAVVTASAGASWARLRGAEGKQLIWVPLRPRRDEVLATLQRYGWPISENPARLRRPRSG